MTNDPILASKLHYDDAEDITDDLEMYRVGHIGRALLEPNARNEINHVLENNPEIFTSKHMFSDVGNYAASGALISDLSVGKASSSLGHNVGSTILIAELAFAIFSSDGSQDYTSGVFLPKEFEGDVLDTQAKAHIAAINLYKKQIIGAGNAIGYEISCIYNCNDNGMIFDAKLVDLKALNQLIYAPKRFAIQLFIAAPVQDEKYKVIDSLALGFEVEWRSAFGQQVIIALVSDPLTEEDGNLKVTKSEGSGYDGMTVFGNGRIKDTDIEDRLFRHIFSLPTLYYGTQDDYPNRLYYNNNVYQLTFNSKAKGFNQYLIETKPERVAIDFMGE